MIDDELEGSQPEVRVHRQECLSNNSLSIVQGIFMVFGFLFRKDRDYVQDYRMALMKRKEKGNELNVAHSKKSAKSTQDSLWSYKISFWYKKANSNDLQENNYIFTSISFIEGV